MGDECSPVGIEMSAIPKRAAIIIENIIVEKIVGGEKFMLYTCEMA